MTIQESETIWEAIQGITVEDVETWATAAGEGATLAFQMIFVLLGLGVIAVAFTAWRGRKRVEALRKRTRQL